MKTRKLTKELLDGVKAPNGTIVRLLETIEKLPKGHAGEITAKQANGLRARACRLKIKGLHVVREGETFWAWVEKSV